MNNDPGFENFEFMYMELHNNKFIAYREHDDMFMAHGYDLVDVLAHFAERFPGKLPVVTNSIDEEWVWEVHAPN